MILKRRTKLFLFNLFFRKLWVKLAVLFLAMVIIPLMIMGMLLISTSQKAVRSAVLYGHREIAVRAANEIGLFIKNPMDLMLTTASMLGAVYPAPWKQETILVELALNKPIFIKLSSANLDGKAIASSELGKTLDRDYSEDILNEIIKGSSYVSGVSIMDNHTPYITMAVPIKKMGKVVGILTAEVNLRGMWDIVDSIRISETGRVFLVSGDGTLIAHEDKKRVLRNENLSSEEDVKSVLDGNVNAIELKDRDGKWWISSYAPVADLGWGVILRQKRDEAYSFSKVMKAQSRTIIAVSVFMAIIISIFIARTLMKPIKSLVSGTKSIARGDLDHKLGVRRRDEIGELIRSFNDMTEQLKRAKARERLSAIGEAAAWIAHELKNSLVAIKSFVLLFPKKHNDEKFIHRFSSLVPDEIERWERMLKDLSGFSYQSELRIAETDAKTIIYNVLEIMREKFIENKIDVIYSPQDRNFHIPADQERLKQVFTNLFINAINAMPKGGSLNVYLYDPSGSFYGYSPPRGHPEARRAEGSHKILRRFAPQDEGSKNTENSPTPHLYTREMARPEFIEVRIKDTGKGMSSEALEKIFEPFHTTNKHGMGLGLAISRRIIQQHGGDISVESEVDVGTTFIVRLPKRGTDESKDNFS
ncbi:MAG: ATP-binding protein [Candidatus Omnitrophota bacterium]